MRVLLLFITIFIFIMIAIFTDAWRFAKTIWLIAEVTPYEQAGSGSDALKILVLGDSTGYGTGAGSGSKSIAGLMGADFPDYSIENNSKNGRTIGEALTEIKLLPTDRSYQLILMQIGGNDILQNRPVDVVRTELLQLFSEAKKRSGNKVVMVSCGNVGGSAAFAGTADSLRFERLSRQFRSMFLEVASESDVTYVDLFHEPADDIFVREPKTYLAIDGLHPSAAGYANWYQYVGPAVRKMLE